MRWSILCGLVLIVLTTTPGAEARRRDGFASCRCERWTSGRLGLHERAWHVGRGAAARR